MSYFRCVILMLIMALAVASTGSAFSEEKKDNYGYQPVTNSGKKWRIAYYQGGASNAYYPYLAATVKGLVNIGWISALDLPDKDRETQMLWNWLSQHISSNYVEFVNDAYYSANWDSETRVKIKNALINRLNNKKDIDLVIAMGTWAGKDLASDEHNTPTMVMSSTDPVRAGIVGSLPAATSDKFGFFMTLFDSRNWGSPTRTQALAKLMLPSI